LLAEGAGHGWWPAVNDATSGDPGHPTFFEVVTVMALIHFAEQRCQIVLWETGLGGRLDATNIVVPLASVITNIAIEHSAYLGDTIEKIAAEKSGIIKPGVPVFTGSENPAALKVIRDVAASRNARLFSGPGTDPAQLARELFPDSYQRKNAGLALTVVEELRSHMPVSADVARQALGTFVLPGRLQRIARGPQTVLTDGAHNPASMRVLRDSIGNTARPTIFGCFKDKDLTSVLVELLPMVSKLMLVPVNSPRSASPDELRDRVGQLDPAMPVDVFESVEAALRAVAGEGEVLVTGSLYLVGEALNYLSTETMTGADEQPLNDWTAASSR